jgi:uncharacterized protein (TIGR03643 family)
MMNKLVSELSEKEIDRIIEMAWEDRTPFEAIKFQFQLTEADVIVLMRNHLKPQSWRLWRERAQKTSLKHLKKRSLNIDRFKCSRQNAVSNNKISKR